MSTHLFRWRIEPEEDQQEFVRNWEDLTAELRSLYEGDPIQADLFHTGENFYASVCWASDENQNSWFSTFAGHPYRVRWRRYQLPDHKLEAIVSCGEW
jgi:hypothetical protein